MSFAWFMQLLLSYNDISRLHKLLISYNDIRRLILLQGVQIKKFGKDSKHVNTHRQ